MSPFTIGVVFVRQYDAAWGAAIVGLTVCPAKNGIIFPSILLIVHGFEHIVWN